ncbi:phosphatase PAP2 family protein [Bacteroidota bacterium]
MKNILVPLLIILLFNPIVEGQLFESEVYKVNPWIDGAITIGAFGMNTLGLAITDKKSTLDSMEIISLDANNINAFDRSATKQDASKMYQAWDRSDIGMRGSFILPFFLLLDKEIRGDWAPVIMLYLQAEGITGTIWSWGAAMHIDRIRPLVYNPDVAYNEKTFKRNKSSFFSGHTSSSAAASFFTAKVYCDYHPELGNKKFIFYGLAVIPPAFTGFYRYKGMKHFPTDVITGMIVGGATGILVPHFHKHKHENLTFIPVTGPYTGFALSLKF